jgi:hypothetical protein
MAKPGSPEPAGQLIATDMAAIRSQSVGRVWWFGGFWAARGSIALLLLPGRVIGTAAKLDSGVQIATPSK